MSSSEAQKAERQAKAAEERETAEATRKEYLRIGKQAKAFFENEIEIEKLEKDLEERRANRASVLQKFPHLGNIVGIAEKAAKAALERKKKARQDKEAAGAIAPQETKQKEPRETGEIREDEPSDKKRKIR